jgi:hypothetical protein
MNYLKSRVCFIVFFLLGAAACHSPDKGKHEKTIEYHLDVAPSISIDTDKLTGNSLIKLKYRWKTGKDFVQPLEALLAKIHFVDAQGEIYFQDDHTISPSPSHWKPDEEYSYERNLYIPLIPRIIQLNVLMGLYDPLKPAKYFLDGTAFSRDKYLVGKISVSPPQKADDLPGARIEYAEGWYGIERDAALKSSWRWMGERSVCTLKNPGREAQLFIKGWVPTASLSKASNIKITLGGRELCQYKSIENEFETIFAIGTDEFKDNATLPLVIETDASYVPSETGKSTDNRRLGIMIKNLYFN